MPDSSIDCSPCRLEWRPSSCAGWAAAALVILVAAALLGTRWAEALPLALQLALGAVAVPAAAHARKRVLSAPGGSVELGPRSAPSDAGSRRACWRGADGVSVEGLADLHEQWPVVVLRFRAGGCTVVFWPDTLCDSGRRALRRWAGAAPDASPLSQFWMG